MKKSVGLLFSSVCFGMVFPVAVLAAPEPVQFSAETYQQTPVGGEVQGRIYVGEHWMRTETYQGGQKVIRITDKEKQNTLIIFPAQQSYMVMQRPQQAADASADRINPCQGMPGAECKRLGEEMVADRKAIKWEVLLRHQGGSQRNLQWMDSQRGIVLRYEGSDGQRSEQRMLGMEKLNGRTVEKWEMTLSNGEQAVKRSYRWFDPELKLMVREEFPGGYLQEMKNIRVEPQDPSLFSIPAGYKKFTPPMKSTGPR